MSLLQNCTKIESMAIAKLIFDVLNVNSFCTVRHLAFICMDTLNIGDNAVTSSIRIAEVFPELVGKKTHALWKVYGGMLKYIINYAFYLARYDAYFHINDDAKKCRYLSITNNFMFSHNFIQIAFI